MIAPVMYPVVSVGFVTRVFLSYIAGQLTQPWYVGLYL